MEKYYYSYDEFLGDVRELIFKTKDEKFDAILGLSRGGLTLAHFMAEGLGIRKVYSMGAISYKSREQLNSIDFYNMPDLPQNGKILITDDIVDSGRTIKEILKLLGEKYPNNTFVTAALFYKKSAVIKPDIWIKDAKEWIDFFWEVDLHK